LRNKCRRFGDCFYFQARRRADEANIIVVNHALLLADAVSEGNVLPSYQHLIVDEAHQLPEIATRSFSVSVSLRGLQMLAAKALKNVAAPPHMVHNMEELGAHFFEQLRHSSGFGRARIKKPLQIGEELLMSLHALRDWLASQEFDHVLDVDDQREKLKLKARALTTTCARYIQCLELLGHHDPEWVLWTERSEGYNGRIELVAAPLKVSEFINDFIFSKSGLESSIWMSATLATAGEDPFAFFKGQIGAPEAVIQSKVSSPFDYRRQSLLYLPSGLPEPNHPDFMPASLDEIERLLTISNGRAFVLFTSYAALNNAFDVLDAKLPYPCKKQGDLSRNKLIEWFRQTPNAVLFGTSSFWEGVSVDGDQLSCVIIDRIPFQSPDDPVYEARCEAMKDDPDSNWFSDLALPHATMRLKQGVGRLIRTRSDRGIVAILDSRLSKKYYGRSVIGCLPPMSILKSLRNVKSVDDVLDNLGD
jgi:ATP-dependent DNA helicase DinG